MTRDLLVWQFDLVWSLAQLHLDQLTDADVQWEPAQVTWTVRRGADEVWRPDFSDEALDPIPVPTVAWLTWHIDWWWSAALDSAHGRAPSADRAAMRWAGTGDAALARIRTLASQWHEVLAGASDHALATEVPYPWDPPKTLAHLASWVNVELTKNIAELGQLRLLRAATPGV